VRPAGLVNGGCAVHGFAEELAPFFLLGQKLFELQVLLRQISLQNLF
jgi:hypothetical protein